MNKRILIVLAVLQLSVGYWLPALAAQTTPIAVQAAGTPDPPQLDKDTTASPATSGEPAIPKEIWNRNCACELTRFWVGAEYLHWWIKDGSAPPPLVTTGSLADAVPGALGQPGTSVILGGNSLDYRAFSGGRLAAGYWFDPDQTWGFEAIGFFLGQRSVQQSVGSSATGSPPLFRPLNDVTTGENSFFLSSPGFVAGNLTMQSTSQLWGVEANAVTSPWQGDHWQVILLAGYRHLSLDESLDISSSTRDFGNFFGTGFLASPSNPGTFEKIGSTIAVTDSFHTRNQFDGGQVGGRAIYDLPGGVYFDVRASVALGNNHQSIDIAGSTVQTQPGLPTATFGSGVLANPGNSGRFQHNAFSVVPTLGLRLGYRLTQSLRAFAAYDFLYWSNVVRPGDQVSRTVDFRSIPTAFAFTPGFVPASTSGRLFQETGFWAQGISVGVEFRY